MMSRRSLLGSLSAAGMVGALSPVESARAFQTGAFAGGMLDAGVHRIEADLVLHGDLVLLPGAQLEIASGATLTLLGAFDAPIARVFSGEGRVDLNRAGLAEAHPEWWGAMRDDPKVDCLAALDACVAAHPCTRLLEGRYHIGNTWRIGQAGRRIHGSSASPVGRERCTEIVLTDGAKDVMLVGLAEFPGRSSAFPEGIEVRSLRVTRSERVEPPTPGLEDRAPAGIRLQHVVRASLEDIGSTESAIGFIVRGTARSFIRRCEALRTRAGARPANDFFWGFFFDGNARIGFAGGNASIYVSDCFALVQGGPPLTGSIGAYLRGAFCDTFLQNFEVAQMGQGILADGSADDPDRELQRTGNADLHIHMPILDALTVSGIELTRLSDHAAVEIVDPYVAIAGKALAAIHFHKCRGQTTVSGGQLLGPGGDSIGVHVVDGEGLALRGLKIRGYGRPVGVTGGRDIEIDVAISNPETKGSQGAVWLKDCDRGTLKPRVKGRGGAFPQGVYLAGGNRHLAIDVTGIDPDAIVGGVANLLVDGPRQIRAAGAFGSNLAQGMFV